MFEPEKDGVGVALITIVCEVLLVPAGVWQIVQNAELEKSLAEARAKGAGAFGLPSRADVLSSLGLDKWRDQRLGGTDEPDQKQQQQRTVSPRRGRGRGNARESRDLEAGDPRAGGPARTLSKCVPPEGSSCWIMQAAVSCMDALPYI